MELTMQLRIIFKPEAMRTGTARNLSAQWNSPSLSPYLVSTAQNVGQGSLL